MKPEEVTRNDAVFLEIMSNAARSFKLAEDAKADHIKWAIETLGIPPLAISTSAMSNVIKYGHGKTFVANVGGHRSFVEIPHAEPVPSLEYIQEVMLAYARGEDLILWKLSRE